MSSVRYYKPTVLLKTDHGGAYQTLSRFFQVLLTDLTRVLGTGMLLVMLIFSRVLCPPAPWS